MLRNMFILKFVAACLFSSSWCLESPEPEALLQPRNYNPHPYNEGGRVPPAIQSLRRVTSPPTGVQARTGPVLFPTNPEDAQNSVDVGHPYAGVARKQKLKAVGRFEVNDQENNINPRVYSGLANYAAKVLKKPATTAQHNGFPDPSLAGHKKNYAFSYTVRDQATGDDFSHSQSQSAAATNGEYRVKLPDGRVQIVSYTADNNGYKADVKYADDDVHQVVHQVQQPRYHQQELQRQEHHQQEHHQQEHHQQEHHQQQHQRQEHHQQQEHHRHQGMEEYVQEYEYYDEPQRGHGQVSQVEVPVYDDNPYHQVHHNHKYQPQPEYVTIYPDKIHSQYLVGDKVRIYPGSLSVGAHAQQQKVVRIGGNIQSPQKLPQIHGHGPVKLADKYTNIGDSLRGLPYAHQPGNILGHVGVQVSTASPPHYSQVYITTPRYSHSSPYSVTPTPGYYKRR